MIGLRPVVISCDCASLSTPFHGYAAFFPRPLLLPLAISCLRLLTVPLATFAEADIASVVGVSGGSQSNWTKEHNKKTKTETMASTIFLEPEGFSPRHDARPSACYFRE